MQFEKVTELEENPTGSIPKPQVAVTEARNPSHVDIIEGGSRVTDTFRAKIILSLSPSRRRRCRAPCSRRSKS